MPRDWFQMKVKPDDATVADVYITDYIGGWDDQAMNEMFGMELSLTAKAFIQTLADLPASVKTIKAHINSPGGDVFAALQIANAIRDQRVTKGRTVETIVEGLAASAASLVAMAGSPLRMSDNALMMVHNAWSFSVGNASDMRKAADELDKITAGSIIPTYQWHTKLEAKDVAELLDAETWMDADDAITYGFADEKVEGLKAAASIDPRSMAKLTVPEQYRDRVMAFLRVEDAVETPDQDEPEEKAEPEADPEEPSTPPVSPTHIDAAPESMDTRSLLDACVDAGLGASFARGLVGRPEAEVSAAIAAEIEARRVKAQLADHIRSACSMARCEDLAEPLIGADCNLDTARALLVRITAKLDSVELDSHLTPNHGAKPKPVIDTVAVYRDINGLGAKE